MKEKVQEKCNAKLNILKNTKKEKKKRFRIKRIFLHFLNDKQTLKQFHKETYYLKLHCKNSIRLLYDAISLLFIELQQRKLVL